jgi:predicted dehydrogenase
LTDQGEGVADGRVRLGIVGCGDVAFRSYLPGIEKVAQEARVVALCDVRAENAERASEACSSWSPGARTYTDHSAMFRDPELEAVINLTPVPFHHEVNHAALEAGLHLYSEKPLSGSVGEARALIELAGSRERMLLCAPAIMATVRFRWLKDLLSSGRLGRPTLATGQLANLGPAVWREYTGNPTAFYEPEVGPLIDQGVYLLHGITGLLGPAKRVQAMGGISIPERTVLGGAMAGTAFSVIANDHVMMQLDFGDATFAQVFSSYAVVASKAPTMEVHCEKGTVSLGDLGSFLSANSPVDIFASGESGDGGWKEGVRPEGEAPVVEAVIPTGPVHFVRCLRGEEEPVLTAEHALHVLEIMVRTGDSIRGGCAVELETSF